MILSKAKINIAMARLGYTAADLAKAYGVTRARIHTILNSKTVRPKTAGRIAKALGVDVTDIIETE